MRSAHGMHARPAALFVQIANKYHSSVLIKKDGETVEAKSIVAILSLCIQRGTEIKLIVEGTDAQDAVKELGDFLEANHE